MKVNMKARHMRLGLWAILTTLIAAITHYVLPQDKCPGARPCAFCARLPAHRDPCFGGCWYAANRGYCNQWQVPVDGRCLDERPLAGTQGYTTCIRRTDYVEFLCCRFDYGCWANPFQPNGQWGGCKRLGFECINPSTGDVCPFIVWNEGTFCHEQNGRPCCDEISPCNP